MPNRLQFDLRHAGLFNSLLNKELLIKIKTLKKIKWYINRKLQYILNNQHK